MNTNKTYKQNKDWLVWFGKVKKDYLLHKKKNTPQLRYIKKLIIFIKNLYNEKRRTFYEDNLIVLEN